MTPSTALLQQMAALLAADTTTLAQVGKVNVHLAKTPFSENPDAGPGGFDEADFDGYAAKAVNSAIAQVFRDPATSDWVIQLAEPAGGWHWQTSGDTNLPQTIGGFYVTSSDNATVYGAQALDEEITLTGHPQGVDLPQVRFRVPLNALS